MEVFRMRADERRATLQEVRARDAPDLLPEFQRQNWALAYETYCYLVQRDGLPELTLARLEHIAHQTPPGRGEVYEIGDKTIILDGAHNPQKLEALLHSLKVEGYSSGAVVANFVESPDSKLDSCIELLSGFASHWIIPEFRVGQDIMNRTSFAAGYVIQHAGDADVQVEKVVDIHDALATLLARPEKTLLITGSLYLVSLLRPEILKLQGK